MARTDPTIYMRIPQELKDKLDAAAAANKRSLTAEVVARLEESLSGTDVGTLKAQHQIELYLISLKTQQQVLSMRRDMLNARMDALTQRLQATAAEAELLARKATTDAEFDESERKANSLEGLEREVELLRSEAEILQNEERVLLEVIQGTQEAIKSRGNA